MKWAMLWALAILILCGIPGRDIPHISLLELLSFDKFVHAGVFFILTLLTIKGLKLQSNYHSFRMNAELVSVLFGILYGGMLEIMQETLFVERSADLYDFIANSFGCLVGLLVYKKIKLKIFGNH